MSNRQFIFLHGRAQEYKDATALKAEWLESLNTGMAENGLVLPIDEKDVRFPFYGTTLYEMTQGLSESDAARIILRGNANGMGLTQEEQAFLLEFLEEVRQEADITDEQLMEVSDQYVIQRGPGQWEWVQAILRAVDRFVPYSSGSAIALATLDVYRYLTNDAIRLHIDTGIEEAFSAEKEAVVVSHSLGTVVAYNLLTRRGMANDWNIRQLITLGSPLGVTRIRRTMRALNGPLRCPPCVKAWFNAMDERDIVALYPLSTRHFPLSPKNPAIENKRDVRNHTTNNHGIAGYLNDPEVAKRIHDALVG